MASFLWGWCMNQSVAAVEMLWEGLQRLSVAPSVPVESSPAGSAKRPPSREQLIDDMPSYMAWVWTSRHAIPASKEALLEDLQGSAVSEKYLTWLLEAYESANGLKAMDDTEWGWFLMNPSDRSTWPVAGQKVFYFFDVVGTHLGQFNGARDENPEDPLTGDAGFSGACGFLDAYDVACWAPRPLVTE